jgi:hypothetical protein
VLSNYEGPRSKLGAESGTGRLPEFKLPETGPIGLEGDRGQMEYRRIQIK